MNKISLKLKLNRDIKYNKKRFKQGQIIKIDVDINNTPLDRFWRNRVKDSSIDNCVEFVPDDKKLISNNKKSKPINNVTN